MGIPIAVIVLLVLSAALPAPATRGRRQRGPPPAEPPMPASAVDDAERKGPADGEAGGHRKSARENGRDHRIVTGIDGSASSLSALRWAIHLARHTRAAVDAVAVWHYPVSADGYGWAPAGLGPEYDFKEIAEKIVADAIGNAVGRGGKVRARAWVVEGDPAQVLLDVSDGADLLVVGDRGDGGSTGALLGSVSQHCVHHACCPVVVIRGEDHD